MGKKVVVFGSFVVDLTGRTRTLPVPGQTVMGSTFVMGPGGKGSNQAVAAHRAGADVTLVTKVGKDVFGKVATDFYEKEGMNTEYIFVDEEKETGCALITVEEGTAQNEIVVISGACGNITEEDIEKSRALIESSDILLLQLEINFDALYKVIDIAHAAGVTIVVNTAPAAELPAEILKKLVTIQYLSLAKKTQTITPTLLGEMVFDTVNASIRPLLNPELTASWEKGLTLVAEGSITEEEYMQKLEGFITRCTEAVLGVNNSYYLRGTYQQTAPFYKKQ